ncbi:HAMP domain-containing sensor histidine kinase [Eubacteriaceae bacterium ES2]|nr:HAMP domain-containing sensor histidine kinase [Eubacteriaceae bacterium ES2]
MSIKLKIPLIILAALLLNVSLLLCYYGFYLADRVNTYQYNMQQTLSAAAEEIAAAIDGESFDYASKYLSAYDNPKNLTFVLSNVQTGQETMWNQEEVDLIGFSQISLLTLSDNSYVLQLNKQVDLFDFTTHGIFQELLFFEIAILIIIFMAVGIIIHFRYVSSLLNLNTSMHLYKDKKLILKETKRKDEIGMLQSSFAQLSKSLEEEKQAGNRIIASISHDIKTPLTSVLGYSERLMKKELEPQKQKQYIKTIYKQSRDIEAIVEEFDDYLSLSAPKKEQVQEYKVSYLCTMLKDEYQHRLEEQSIIFTIQNQSGIDATICTELLKLRRVFANIIGNSIRHAGVQNLRIDVYFVTAEDKLFISITDNGRGIFETDLNHIFEPFYTSDQSRHISGLGLSICKQIVEGNGGSISALTPPAGGLQICITLPIKK